MLKSVCYIGREAIKSILRSSGVEIAHQVDEDATCLTCRTVNDPIISHRECYHCPSLDLHYMFYDFWRFELFKKTVSDKAAPTCNYLRDVYCLRR